ncbi:MAG: diguanylate cyclase domain-containing protein [Desulfonatronovibrio sp.]
MSSQQNNQQVSRAKILIVDDTPTNIQVLAEILGQDYEIFFSLSGSEGLSMAEAQQPDIILLDIMMPKMDGFEVCQKLKENPVTKNIPVIFITALNMEEDEAKGFELGAVDYITKPIRPSVVRARIKNHVELKRYRDYLENISMKDGLTGVPNRRKMDEYLEQEWKRSKRKNKPISLLMLDIDHFKLYNDNYGHSQGDECLKKIASAIEKSLSRPADLAARFGGEEFVCILPETDEQGAKVIARRVQKNIKELSIPHEYSPVDSLITLSIGIATTNPDESASQEDLLNNADQMLYQAKNSGRNLIQAVSI